MDTAGTLQARRIDRYQAPSIGSGISLLVPTTRSNVDLPRLPRFPMQSPDTLGIVAFLQFAVSSTTVARGTDPMALRAARLEADVSQQVQNELRRLREWETLSPEQWDEMDSDPLAPEAANVAEHILTSLVGRDGLRLSGRAHVGLMSSRDGGLGIMLSTTKKELEYSINPNGDITGLLINLDESEGDQRYTDIDDVDANGITEAASRLLA